MSSKLWSCGTFGFLLTTKQEEIDTVKLGNISGVKAFLHALKYPHLSIFGILLGKRAGSTVELIDSIPLFHGPLLVPMFEVAMNLVSFLIIQFGSFYLWISIWER